MNTALARSRSVRSIPALVVTLALVLAGLVTGATPVMAVPEAAPTITVSKTVGLVSGDVVTVRGAGFGDQTVVGARPPLAGRFAGVYVAFGSYAEVWRPSEGAGSGTRKNGDTRWIVNAEDVATIGGAAAGGVAMGPDGTFEVQLTVDENFEGALADGNFGIYTYAGSGATHAPFETYTPMEFDAPAPAPASPSVSVSKTDDLLPGDVVTVRGTGFFDPSVVGTRAPLAGKFAGVYVTFGSFETVWKPSEGAPSTARVADRSGTRWFVNAEDVATIGGAAAGGYAINPDGSFETHITVDDAFAGIIADGNLGIYTYAGAGVKHAPFETYTPVTFRAPTPAPTPAPEPVPADPAIVAPATAGSLIWGVKAAFRNYVAGPIAHGTITANGVRASGGGYVFGQASGGTFTEAGGVGTSNYSGSVRFYGHGGAMDVTIANPVVRVDSATSGTLLVSFNGAQVPMAALSLGSAARSANNGAVTYTNVPATLTAAGTAVFALNGSPFYATGSALDPITFTIGAPAPASGGSTIVAAFQRPAAATPAPVPPATEGIRLLDGAVAPGGTVTIEASGFEPNETGILVVLYSTPTVLDRNATADATGVVRWTGVLPADFTGEHTLTLQGSVSRGMVVDLADAAIVRTAMNSCVVADAHAIWGFKETFRAYISGSIAHGEWVVSDGLEYETPNFLWKNGTGSFDRDTMTGEIALPGTLNFNGHGGVLDTTLSNLRVQFDGSDTAHLVFDIAGDRQDGTQVDERNVQFVALDLRGVDLGEEDGELTLADVPTALTAAGEAAFGTYEAGSDFDPITIAIAQAGDCAAAATDGEAEERPVGPDADDDASDLTWLVWALGALVVLLAAALVTVLLRARTKA